MKTIRQSILECYVTCPKKCLEEWGEYGEEGYLERPENESTNKYAMVGIKFHETMELWGRTLIDTGRRMTFDELLLDLNERMASIDMELFDDDEDYLKYLESVQEQLRYSHDVLCQTNSLLEVEYNFSYDDMFTDMPPVTGTIDRIEGQLATRDVSIGDYKTGRMYTKKKANSSIQACLYSLAFYRKYGFLPKEFIFYFTKHGRQMKVQITNEFINNVSKEIVSIVYKMKMGEFPENTKNKFFCKNFCKAPNCRHNNVGKKVKGWEGVVGN